MTEPKARERSEAQREASRRNGARSRGPKTAKGKAKSARNALRHGLRARQTILPADLPDWIAGIEQQLAWSRPIGRRRREYLDALGPAALLIEQTGRLIQAEMVRLAPRLAGAAPDGSEPGVAEAADLAVLRKLLAYRRRFGARRDALLKKIATEG